jgi:hypothetical protein
MTEDLVLQEHRFGNFDLKIYDARGSYLFHGILNSSTEAGDSRIDRGGTIYTKSVVGQENNIKQCIIPRRKFTVSIYVILDTNGKGQINTDNERGDYYQALQVEGRQE